MVPDAVLVDGNWDFVGLGCTERIVRGDARCLSIAAASILAKVTRDRYMRAEARHFPGYDFECEQGLPLSAPQDGAAGVRPHVDPPADVGLHGRPGLEAAGPAGRLLAR